MRRRPRLRAAPPLSGARCLSRPRGGREESSLTPWYAASLWPKFEAAKRQRGGRLRLGSPAPAPCGAACTGPGDPIAWLTDFYSACNQARPGRARCARPLRPRLLITNG